MGRRADPADLFYVEARIAAQAQLHDRAVDGDTVLGLVHVFQLNGRGTVGTFAAGQRADEHHRCPACFTADFVLALFVLPALFMAYGDAVTGLTRSVVYNREFKGNMGSMAMLGACLLLAWCFYQPFWIGAAGAVVATLAERFTPVSKGFWDDNWSIVLSSLLVMSLLGAIC